MLLITRFRPTVNACVASKFASTRPSRVAESARPPRTTGSRSRRCTSSCMAMLARTTGAHPAEANPGASVPLSRLPALSKSLFSFPRSIAFGLESRVKVRPVYVGEIPTGLVYFGSLTLALCRFSFIYVSLVMPPFALILSRRVLCC